ncbi:cytochrome c1 [Halomonas sp. MC140]|nr:cytochrome c1 [Halomonas sp. MC140]MDN7133258.1 cytochrome c1 [Halomonas sp. MC140]
MLLVGCFTAMLAAATASAAHSMEPDLQDQASLQNGMKLYVNYCMGCHSLEYQRFSRAADDLGIPQDLAEANLIFSSKLAYNDQMLTALESDDAKQWFGAVPPDLTLRARLRSPDWIYAFLLGFYQDASRPTGVNNTVSDLVAMPNVLEPLQGVQTLACAEVDGRDAHALSAQSPSCKGLKITQPGELAPAEFEQVVYDLTNFLAYVGEPSRLKAQALAPKVLIFIFIFGVMAYLLKREYWRDIH